MIKYQVCCILVLLLQRCRSDIETIKSGPIKMWSSGKALAGKLSQGGLWNMKTFHTCGIGREVDFILLIEPVSFVNFTIDVVYVNVQASFQMCHSAEGQSIECTSNKFEVYVYRGNNTGIADKFTRKEFPSLLANNLSLIYNITGELDGTITNRTFTFSQNGASVVMFVIRSRGACGTLHNMSMYYHFCPRKFFNSVKFNKTSSPASGSTKEVLGDCSQNSKPSDRGQKMMMGHCYSNGTWNIDQTVKCLCMAGYESNKTLGCTFCNPGYFKNNISNRECNRCPLNSKSIRNATDCVCKQSFYNFTFGSDCYAPLTISQDVNIRQLKTPGTVNISWSKSHWNGNLNDTVFYQVECYCCGNVTSTSCKQECVGLKFPPSANKLNQTYLVTYVVVSGLETGLQYLFKIYPRNRLNGIIGREKWNYTQKIYEPSLQTAEPPNTEHPEHTSGDGFTIYYFVAAACVLAVILFALLVACCLLRRRAREKRLPNGGFSSLDMSSLHTHQDYVDPTLYAKPEEAVSKFTSELDPKLIFIDVLIGGGEFGDVYKGKLKLPDKSRIPVAIKTLKNDASYKSQKDFLLEASVMGQFENPNVVKLQGVVTKSKPRMIVLEFMSNGSLDNFLKSNYAKLTQLQLIGMARGVAGGMRYLSAIKFVHRDVAARNVLVNDSLLCKIADFGLSRELDSKYEEYATTGGKIPVRWTAPEAFSYYKFSSASDVWSYGIVLWEIFTFGQRPYGDWDNLMVIAEIDRGYRLPAPTNCPQGVHDLMLHCWSKERLDRPSFSQITAVIDKWIRSPEMMDEALDMSQDITKWLESIKMDTYAQQFTAAGYKRPVDIAYLNDSDLKKLGVTLIGHRNKILKNAVLLQVHESPCDSVAI